MMEINGLFIAVVVLFAVLMILGYMRGILAIVFGVASWVFFFMFVNWASPQVYVNLQDSAVEKSVSEHVQKLLEEKVSQGINIDTLLPEDTVIKPGIESAKEGMVNEAAAIITAEILRGLSFVISAVIALIICLVVLIVIKIISRAPLLGGANHTVGLLFGAMEALLVVWVLMYIVSLSPTSDFGESMLKQIESNMILKLLYDSNVISSFINI